MIIKLDEPKVLAEIIGIISEIVTEVRIKVGSEGMSMIAIDPANVALVSFFIPARVFSQFEASGETLGVSLENLKAILKRCTSTSSLVMKREDNLLQIDILDKIRRSFTLALIDIETEEKSVPNLTFTAKVEINTFDLSDSIEDCAIVADSCSFAIDEGKFVIEGKGLNSARSEFSGDEATIEGIGKSKYSLEYLQKFNKAAKLSEKVIVNFGNDYPLKLEYIDPKRELMFVLAPRVETGNY
jgi:proliferating cell nuclear antigen